MRRSHRVALTGVVLLTIFLAFAALTRLGRQGEGPLSRVLTDVGVAISDGEKAITNIFRGPGREAHLAWFAPLRNGVDSLKHPRVILLGAFDNRMPESLEGVVELETTLGVRFPLIHMYAAWGDRPEQQFPVRMMRAIWNLGSVPVVTWEPWLTDFESSLHEHLPLRSERDRGGLAAVARGEYDFYIDVWAKDAAEFGKPLFLRFAHEMNDPYRYPWGPQNNSVIDFLQAWVHVHDRFQQQGATNVIWVWSPHLAYDYYPYYPGDQYVDWVATGALNFGTVANWSKWWTFDDIFGKKYIYVQALNKPIMIAEFGTLAVGGNRGAWFRRALEDFPRRYPDVRALLFFNVSSDASVTPQALDWTVIHDTTSSRIIRQEIARWDSLDTGN